MRSALRDGAPRLLRANGKLRDPFVLSSPTGASRSTCGSSTERQRSGLIGSGDRCTKTRPIVSHAPSASEALAEFATAVRWAEIPKPVAHAANRHLLDVLG